MEQQQHKVSYHPAPIIPDRDLPHAVTDGVWMWSVPSPGGDSFLNGYLIQTGPNESFIVDPPAGGPQTLDGFTPLPAPSMIILTNGDHGRASELFKHRFGIPVWIPAADAGAPGVVTDRVYGDGEMFPGGWQAIRLEDQKTPGETALYNAARQIIILGDALTVGEDERLSLLPNDFYDNKVKALDGLRRLEDLEIITILPGHGDPLMRNGSGMITDALRHA